MKKILFLLSVSLMLSVGNSWADGLDAPQGKVILTIAGDLQKTNSEHGAEFDLEMLMALKQTIINTKTPWTQGVTKFEGPAIKELFSHIGATGKVVTATALNGYRITIPMFDIDSYGVIIALKRNDKVLSVRTKGPNWVIYPWSDHKILRDNVFYTRAVWQLNSLEID